MDPKQVATVALQLIDTATIRVDEQSLNAANAVRVMLKGIASGQYVLSEAPVPVAPSIEPAKGKGRKS